MSNDVLKMEELFTLLEAFKSFDLFPEINYDKLPTYKLIIIMEKYKNYKNTLAKNTESIVKLNQQIIKHYELMNKALRRKDEEKAKIIVDKHNNLIKKIEGQINKLEKMNKMMEIKHDDNLKLFISTQKKN